MQSARGALQSAYGVREVAGLLGLTEAQIRRYVREGLLQPERGPRGALRFSFQDLAFLKLVKQLGAARIAPRRIDRALRRLREQLPGHEPLSGVSVSAAGNGIVVRRHGRLWDPLSGQQHFDFEPEPMQPGVVTLRGPGSGDATDGPLELHMEARDWFLLGCELHETQPEAAADAYGRALALDPALVDARVNLGCLDHAAGRLAEAERQYRAALALRAADATALFNLGVALEDQGRGREARVAYERTLAAEPGCADAHYNLARLLDREGESAAALRHLRAYRKLTQER